MEWSKFERKAHLVHYQINFSSHIGLYILHPYVISNKECHLQQNYNVCVL